MLLRSGMNSQMVCAVQHELPSSGKSSKLPGLQKPNRHSLPITGLLGMAWLCQWINVNLLVLSSDVP